jgi:dipeptide transport system substrate-binding protein
VVRPQYDSLVKQAKQVTDRERTALYQQAQQRSSSRCRSRPVAHSTVNQPLSVKVSEFKVSPFGRNVFRRQY